MKKMRLLCPFGPKDTPWIAAGAILGSFISLFVLAFALTGESAHPFILFLVTFAGVLGGILLLAHLAAYVPNRVEKDEIRRAKPLEWREASETDLQAAKDRHKFNWVVFAVLGVSALYIFFDMMQHRNFDAFYIIFLLIIIAALAFYTAFQIVNNRFWSDKNFLLTECAETSVFDVIEVRRRQRYHTETVYYMVVFLEDGKYYFKQYDNSYICSKIHIIRRGNRYTYVQCDSEGSE